MGGGRVASVVVEEIVGGEGGRVRGVGLRVEEREMISRELAGGLSCRAIAVVLGRHQSVVSREVARHGGRGSYRAVAAQECADRGRGRPKERVLAVNTLPS